MKTLKQLKKDITTQSILKLIYYRNGIHPFINIERQVKEIHNNFIVLTDGIKNSRLEYPKAKELIYKDNEFSILDYDGKPYLTYKIENLNETENKEKTSIRQEKILKKLSNVDKRINKFYSINDYQVFTDLYSVVFLKDNKLNVEEEKAPETLLNIVERFNKNTYEEYFKIKVDDVIKAFNKDSEYLTIVYKKRINITLIKSSFINMCLFLGLALKSTISISGSLSLDTMKNCDIANYTLTHAIKINNLNNNDYAFLQVARVNTERKLYIN